MSLDLRLFRGPEIAQTIEALAALRITVFRDWPYLYAGDAAYEQGYLASYARDGAVLVAVYEGAEMVGASTAMPLLQHTDSLSTAFSTENYDLSDLYYCAETVLLPSVRGRGLYRRLFETREAEGRSSGFGHAVFCGVIRPEDHPAKPRDAHPLDPIWRRFGYAPVPGARATFTWRDIGARDETPKPMQFWIKRL